MRAAGGFLRGRGRRLLATLFGLLLGHGALAAGVVIEADGYVNEEPRGEPVAGAAPASVGAGDAATASPPAAGGDGDVASAGPGVEMITGGNSKDGAAHVGRLPMLD